MSTDVQSVTGHGRIRTRALVVALLALLLIAPGAVANGSEPSSPFVGAWESIDPPPDSSHVRMQIGESGRWHLRDEAGSVCLFFDYGFVPVTVQGQGEFVGTSGFSLGNGDVYCHPRDGRGRALVGTFPIGDLVHLPVADVLIDVDSGVCWWRSGTGSPSDCPVG